MSCGCFGASTNKKKRTPPHTPAEIDGKGLWLLILIICTLQ